MRKLCYDISKGYIKPYWISDIRINSDLILLQSTRFYRKGTEYWAITLGEFFTSETLFVSKRAAKKALKERSKEQ